MYLGSCRIFSSTCCVQVSSSSMLCRCLKVLKLNSITTNWQDYIIDRYNLDLVARPHSFHISIIE